MPLGLNLMKEDGEWVLAGLQWKSSPLLYFRKGMMSFSSPAARLLEVWEGPSALSVIWDSGRYLMGLRKWEGEKSKHKVSSGNPQDWKGSHSFRIYSVKFERVIPDCMKRLFRFEGTMMIGGKKYWIIDLNKPVEAK